MCCLHLRVQKNEFAMCVAKHVTQIFNFTACASFRTSRLPDIYTDNIYIYKEREREREREGRTKREREKIEGAKPQHNTTQSYNYYTYTYTYINICIYTRIRIEIYMCFSHTGVYNVVFNIMEFRSVVLRRVVKELRCEISRCVLNTLEFRSIILRRVFNIMECSCVSL